MAATSANAGWRVDYLGGHRPRATYGEARVGHARIWVWDHQARAFPAASARQRGFNTKVLEAT
jgi:hypothetical protein